MTAQEQQLTRVAWDKIAPGYDKTNTPTQMWLGNEGLRRAGLLPGMRFLDVASGSGALSIPAARLGAQVLAADQSPVMLDLLKQRASKEGLTTASIWRDRSLALWCFPTCRRASAKWRASSDRAAAC